MSDQVAVEACPVGHLPLVRWAVRELRIDAVLDELSPKHNLAHVSDADCVVAMILNILSDRLALYAMQEWLSFTDVELLIGEGCQADFFHDTRLGTALDRLDDLGTDVVMGRVVEVYLARDDRPKEYSAHLDTTSVSLYGRYHGQIEPEVTHGYSKDKRPDLKQLIFGLVLHGSAGIPLVSDVAAGNTADPVANRDLLARLGPLLPPEDEVTVVADCKAVDAVTIGRVVEQGLHIVSLVPDTFKMRGTLIEYRKQFLIENHTGFRWLKSEAAVSPIFLKTTRRIRAMGLVLTLALMVRNFIQFSLHGALAKGEEGIRHPYTKKVERRLTTEMAMAWFMGIQSMRLSIGGSPWTRQAPRFRDTARQILDLLGVDDAWFTTPPKPNTS